MLLNVIDVPEACSFLAPAVVSRGELQVAIGTGGASPSLAARLRRELESAAGRRVRSARRRSSAPCGVAGRRRRAAPAVLAALLDSPLLDLLRRGDRPAVDALLARIAGDALHARSSRRRGGGLSRAMDVVLLRGAAGLYLAATIAALVGHRRAQGLPDPALPLAGRRRARAARRLDRHPRGARRTPAGRQLRRGAVAPGGAAGGALPDRAATRSADRARRRRDAAGVRHHAVGQRPQGRRAAAARDPAERAGCRSTCCWRCSATRCSPSRAARASST